MNNKHPIYGNDNIAQYELTKVLRNGNLEVLDFYTEIRKMVQNKSHRSVLVNFLAQESNKHHEKIIFYKDKKEFIKKYLSKNRIGTYDDIILTFTNDRVNEYNRVIRDFYLKKLINEPNVPDIHLSDLFIVQETTEKFQNSECIKVNTFKESEFNISGKVIKGYKCTDEYNRPYNILSRGDEEEFNKIIKILAMIAEERKAKRIWENFYKVKELFLNVKYQYSSTITKSQGSSIDNVFVDCSGLDGIESDLLNRLFYVGISRAKDTVNILL